MLTALFIPESNILSELVINKSSVADISIE